jgi:hypothetical protein
MYALDRGATAAENDTQAFNYIVLRPGSVADFQPDFHAAICTHYICVIKGAGSCVRDSRLESPIP